MSFFNTTRFPALCFEHLNAQGELRNVIVLSVGMEIGQDGELTVMGEQPKLNFAELAYGDPTSTSLQRESDLAPEKPLVDLIVNADAYSPQDRPERSFPAGVAVRHPARNGKLGDVIRHSVIMVTGPRKWKRRNIISRSIRSLIALSTFGMIRPGIWRLTRATPVVSVAVRYDLAYGGAVALDQSVQKPDEVLKQCIHPDNPFGCGYVPTPKAIRRLSGKGWSYSRNWLKRWRSTNTSFDAPQIELAKQGIPSDPRKPYPLAGWGTVSKHARLRLKFAGTFDEKWDKERHPLLPEDFNPRYWNGAHPDLQFAEFPSDAQIELHGLIPASRRKDQILQLDLPGYAFPVSYRDALHDSEVLTSLKLDTVHVNVPNNCLTMLYRLNLPSLTDPHYIHVGEIAS